MMDLFKLILGVLTSLFKSLARLMRDDAEMNARVVADAKIKVE